MDNQHQPMGGMEASRHQETSESNEDTDYLDEKIVVQRNDEIHQIRRIFSSDLEMAERIGHISRLGIIEPRDRELPYGIPYEPTSDPLHEPPSDPPHELASEAPQTHTKFFPKGAATTIQEHENSKNLKLLGAAYIPTWRDNESDFFKQESPIGNTVLHIAAMYGNDEGVEVVAQKAPHLFRARNSNGDTPLHIAAKAGHISTLKKLLIAHVHNLQVPYSIDPMNALFDILVTNEQGNNFFHEALLNGQKGSVMNCLDFKEEEVEGGFKELLERAALFWVSEKERKSSFYLAIEVGDKEVVDRALAKLTVGLEGDHALQKFVKDHPLSEELMQLIPLDPHYSPKGESPFLAAILKRDQDILKTILTKKPEWIHLRDKEHRIPLHYAASLGYFEGVECLLEKCVSCTIERDKYGFFPLHLASFEGHVDVVRKLLQHCLDPREMLDNSGRNILHLAAESGKFKLVSYILNASNHGLEKMINDKDINGNTPLHLATLCCRPKIVHALTWDKRVDLTLVNGKNQRALDVTMQFPLVGPSLRQRLTWTALKSAGAPHGEPQPSSVTIRVPPQSPKSPWGQNAPNVDPYKDRINTLMLVSTLIVTVTFAAGFTMPGGTNDSDPEQGMATMLHHIWFKLFILCITVSLYGAIGVTIMLIWAQLGEITLVNVALKVARPLLGVVLATLSMAFLAGIHLVISDLSWLATASLAMAVAFIFVLMLLYTLLWFPSPASFPVVRYISYYPFLFLASLVETS